MERLFSYGTLQLSSVQEETFGRLLQGEPDVLVGYKVSDIKIKDKEVLRKSGKEFHPILKATGKSSDRVEGTIFEITAQELAQADEYEVEEYARIEAEFESGLKAWAYVDAARLK